MRTVLIPSIARIRGLPPVRVEPRIVIRTETLRGVSSGDGDLSDRPGIREERVKSTEEPVTQRQARRPSATPTEHGRRLQCLT